MEKTTRKIVSKRGLTLLLFLLMGPVTLLTTPVQSATTPDDLLAQGKMVYQKECSVCHGSEGRGDGPAAYLLFPKPRDFTTGLFKIRSTPSGQMPTDQDLFRTISQGMPGSAMPGFTRLSEGERWALVAYIKALSVFEKDGQIYNHFALQKEPHPLAIPPATPLTPESLARGKQLYIDAGCVDCHGVKGKGDGPSAPDLKDELGYPILPNDFTRGIFKGGGKEEEIYLRMMTGLAGTPMPSYEGVFTPEEGWDVVHYIHTLSEGKVAQQPSTGTLRAQRSVEPLPTAPLDPRWDTIPAATIPLMLLWQRPEWPQTVSVRALHNGTEIAFLLEWEDEEVASNFLRAQAFADGVAIQWSLSTELPHFSMGEKGGLVNIWYWRADWQLDIAQFRDIETVYPHLAVDYYPFPRGGVTANRNKNGQRAIVSAPAHDPTFLTGWGSGNLVSIPWRKSAVQDLNAEGFGTLTAQPPEKQDVSGLGFWVAGKWRVLFTRPMQTADPADIQIIPGKTLPVAFAVWDGSKGDRNGQKSITTWYFLTVDP